MEAMNLAKEAYEAYANHTGWKSLATGAQLPQWDALSSEIQAAWMVSAGWVIGRVTRMQAAKPKAPRPDLYWYKLFAILMHKYRRQHEVFTEADVLECREREINIVVQELPDGLHVKLVSDAAADAILSRN
jgi:hypothetical protein